MEYMESDLDLLLKHKLEFTEQHLLRLVYNSLCALAFMHEANIMHRDIKSANILITSDCDAKICDFGLSRSIPQQCMDLGGLNSLHLRQLTLKSFQNTDP